MPAKMITGERPRRDGLIESLLLYAVLFMPALMATGAAPALDELSWYVTYWILGLPQIGLLGWGLKRRGVIAERGAAKPSPSVAFRAPALALAALGAGWIVLIFLAMPSVLGFGDASEWKSVPYVFTRVSYLPLAITTSFITGYREELFFRGWLQSDFADAGLRGWAPVALSAAMFGVLHMWQGWRGIAATTVVGFLFAWRYAKRRDLHEIAIAHGVYNSIAMALSLLVASRSAG